MRYPSGLVAADFRGNTRLNVIVSLLKAIFQNSNGILHDMISNLHDVTIAPNNDIGGRDD